MERKHDKRHDKRDDKRSTPEQQDKSVADDRSRADNPDYRGPAPQGGKGTPSQAEGER